MRSNVRGHFAGADDLARLLASLLLPPLVMGVLLGVYVLFFRKS